jgi:hypothetical protein
MARNTPKAAVPQRSENAQPDLSAVLELLRLHRDSFYAAEPYARKTAHPVPSDTRAWSQILVSLLTGIRGIAQKKGADLEDGSDVKAANVWHAIDTPRFNGCIKSGRKGAKGSIATLDPMPYLFFVMWDQEPNKARDRCRVWVVRPGSDRVFRAMATKWYEQRAQGVIRSDNFQLHPPRNLDSDVFRNTCGNLIYPLLFRADWTGSGYEVITSNPSLLETGTCVASH